jgi:hypothetical protein
VFKSVRQRKHQFFSLVSPFCLKVGNTLLGWQRQYGAASLLVIFVSQKILWGISFLLDGVWMAFCPLFIS